MSWHAVVPRIKELRETVYLLNKNKLTQLAVIIIGVLIFIAVLAPWLAPTQLILCWTIILRINCCLLHLNIFLGPMSWDGIYSAGCCSEQGYH